MSGPSLVGGQANLAAKSRQVVYLRLNGKYLRQARELLKKGDYPQASEKLWGAAAEIINAVARKMLVSIYHVLKRQEEYHGQRDELLERKIKRVQRTVDSSLQAK